MDQSHEDRGVDRLLSLEAVRDRLGRPSRAFLYARILQPAGPLRTVKLGRSVRVREADLARLVADLAEAGSLDDLS
jgi:hypothetical protein